uniref:Protein KTI12 homolog n=1 Tax=Hirondellea gigas TaxID=1518452 RepID=A0A2P2I5X3_9CRUS
MPLIMISGMPCTGKTTCAQILKEHFVKKDKNVILISEHDYVTDKNEVYNDSNKEKTVRSSIKAAVLRSISTNNLVLLDAPNYIKGYRYELFCVCKQHSTTHCVVQCVVPVETAQQWNQNTQQPYDIDTFNALVYRYESPDSRNRWDQPLFSAMPDTSLDLEGIETALYSGKKVKPHQATQLQPLTHNNFLHNVDKKTQEVVAAILTAQKTEAGDEIKIPGSQRLLCLGRKVTLPELSRARRQFISYTKSHPVHEEEIAACFVTYLNTTLA